MSDVSLFLGSGASASFGKPTTLEFKDKLRKEAPFSDDPVKRLYHELLTYSEFPDIEYVLECLKNLAEFKQTQGSRLIFNTNKDIRFIADGREAQIGVLASNIDRFYDHIINRLFDFYTITLNDLPLVKKIYSTIAGPLLEKGKIFEIFTTNYDLAIEKFCALEGITAIDGFEYDPVSGLNLWNPEIFDAPTNSNTAQVNLYKLHGSLNWVNHVQHSFVKLGDNQTRVQTGFMKSNLLIHPTLSPKVEEGKEPFKTLIENFGKRLEKSKSCIVIGFSFRDRILNGYFKKFVESGKKLVSSLLHVKTIRRNLT